MQATDGSRIFAQDSLEAFKTDCKGLIEREPNITKEDDLFCLLNCNDRGLYSFSGIGLHITVHTGANECIA